MVLAENLVMLRNVKGMTQEQVAEVIGISRQSYAKWEQGETMPDIEKGSASFGSISEVNRKLTDKDPKNNFILTYLLIVSADLSMDKIIF